MLCGKGKIIYVRFILPFMKNGRSSKSRYEISIRGRGCNTLVLCIAFGTCVSWAQPSSKHSWAWAYGISSYSYILSYVMLIIYMHMLVTMCDQCKRCLWGYKNTLDTSRMVGNNVVFMTWANFASKCWITLNAFYMILVWPKMNSSLECLHGSAPLIKVIVLEMGNKLYLRIMN